jgi:xylose isomerase
MSILDVWKNSYSENTSRKVWAAKYIARHPNLVALELSSFKCGHDAPIYSVVEEIVEHSGTPYFCFKDIDENKPTGSIRIRVETIGYFLKRYREDMVKNRAKANNIDQQLREFEARLRREMLRDKLDSLSGAFETGSMPQIHVSIGALAASNPAARQYEAVQGD